MEQPHFFAEDFAAHAAGHSACGYAGVGDGADDERLIGVAEVVGVVDLVAELHHEDEEPEANHKAGTVSGEDHFGSLVDLGGFGLDGGSDGGDATGGAVEIFDFADAVVVAFECVFGVGDLLLEGEDGLGFGTEVFGGGFLLVDSFLQGCDLLVDGGEIGGVVVDLSGAVQLEVGFVGIPGVVSNFLASGGDLGVQDFELFAVFNAVGMFEGGVFGCEDVVSHLGLDLFLHPLVDLRIGVGGDAGEEECLLGHLAHFEVFEGGLEAELFALEFGEGFLGVADDFDENFLILVGPDHVAIAGEASEFFLGVLEGFVGSGLELFEDGEGFVDVLFVEFVASTEVGVDDGVNDGGRGCGVLVGHHDADVLGGTDFDINVVGEITDLIGELAEPGIVAETNVFCGAGGRRGFS